jgi:ATPase family associated with various cellular activities (AAA)
VRLDELLPRLRRFVEERVPRFLAFKKRRSEVIDEARRRLKLNEIQPKVLSSFVRNKLVNDVYLPLVGDNLAKQMGAAGAKKRTDLMGLLLLVSPPGYGKTTLMEYVASRLGLVYVKANGPALGHDTTSLDPNEAPNATARAEVEKINFAFEMGNNVLLLVDDIQHTHPELLQKFISLCDGTRRVEGVWKGKTRTYDLRGKKFVVCMAGNPYTESGDKFRIPDMLANRADTYNLGDILGGKLDQFALSFVENALTSNASLAPLATRDPADIYLFIRMAQGEQVPTTDFKHGYSGAEIDEIVRVLKKLIHVQQTLLKVNATYISSAATDERFRSEPGFKLQGSYRNMNKLAEKIVAVMNDDELERLVDDHYRSESQTLTTGAEHNLLKLAELRGRMSAEQRARWDEIKKGFARTQIGGDASADPATRVTSTIAALAQRMDAIGFAIDAASKATLAARPDDSAQKAAAQAAHVVAEELKALRASMESSQKAAHKAAHESASAQTQELAKALAATTAQTAAVLAAQKSDDDERKKPPPRPTAQKADPALLAKLDAAIEALSAAKIDVRLEAPAPAGIAELVRLQTILIEASLLPLVKGMASSIEHEKGNAEKLEAALEALKALDAKGLPAPQPVQLETYRPFKPAKPSPKGTRTEDE